MTETKTTPDHSKLDQSTLGRLNKVSAEVTHEGAVLRLVLDSPPGNVLDSEMVAGLRQAAAAARTMPDLKLLVFTGAGKHFSFGASVEEHRPGTAATMLGGFHGLFRDLMACDVPALAFVRGQCLGGGLELAAFCDWLWAGERASLGQPEIKLGVFAPMGSLLLPWRCRGSAAELLLTGKPIDAVTGMALGLVDEVFPESGADAHLDRWIHEEILPLSASSLRRARRAARWELHRMLAAGIEEVERLYLDDLMATADAVEGIQAFLEKRLPAWKNA
jgi:cyclohexa-1,5-dienecarbonyl-CoA hydratase